MMDAKILITLGIALVSIGCVLVIGGLIALTQMPDKPDSPIDKGDNFTERLGAIEADGETSGLECSVCGKNCNVLAVVVSRALATKGSNKAAEISFGKYKGDNYAVCYECALSVLGVPVSPKAR